MKKLINFIESEWYRPVIISIASVIVFVWCAVVLAIAENREKNRIELQTQAWIEQGYPIGE